MEKSTTLDTNGKTTDANVLSVAQALRDVRDGGKWDYTHGAYILRYNGRCVACAVGLAIVARRPHITNRQISNLSTSFAELWIAYAYKVWPELVGYEFYDSGIVPMGFFEMLDAWNRQGKELNKIIDTIERSVYKVVS